MDIQSFRRETFHCGDCSWTGPGAECKTVDSLGNMAMIGCPNCEAPIRIVASSGR